MAISVNSMQPGLNLIKKSILLILIIIFVFAILIDLFPKTSPISSSDKRRSSLNSQSSLKLDRNNENENVSNISSFHERVVAMRKMGFDPIEIHSFKSPYITNPKNYEDDITPSSTNYPRQGREKIISVHNIKANWWFKRSTFNSDFKKCPYKCQLDYDGKKTEQADLVLFICKGLTTRPPRRENQLWGVACWESSENWNIPDYNKYWEGQINLLMTYRQNSDIFIPYLNLAWRDSTQLYSPGKYLEIASQKTKTAVWYVSNCKADRLKFAQKMQQYVDIDIFGRCGETSECDSKFNDFPCRKEFNTTYKFYLSFENTFCTDYVTEKFHRIFKDRQHILPVAMGALDYDKFIPKDTYVNGNKFKNAKELAFYLKELGNDMPRYSRMLQEKDRLTVKPYDMLDWCDVCEAIHTREFPPKKNVKKLTHFNSCKDSGFRLG